MKIYLDADGSSKYLENILSNRCIFKSGITIKGIYIEKRRDIKRKRGLKRRIFAYKITGIKID